MKVLLINGSPNERGCTYTALCEVQKTLNADGVETKLIWLGTAPMADCIACGKCGATGRCVYSDQVNEIIEDLDNIDGMVLGSPVYYAGPSGRLCSFLDRLFYSAGSRMSGKLGACVVSCRRGGATAAFDRLNKYFTICKMNVVGSQYWNQVHGNSPEEVQQDIEGLQTMRTLAQNMAWLLKSIKAGAVPPPEYETKISTNYIR